MNKLIAWIPIGGRTDPASRLRVFEVADALRERYAVDNLFAPFVLKRAPDVLVIQKACDARTLGLVRQLAKTPCRVCYDLCDPIWLQADENLMRGWNVEAMLAAAHRIVVPTTAMAEAVRRQYPKADIRQIPDAINTDDPILRPRTAHEHTRPMRIGWIGTTLNMEHLPMLVPMLAELQRTHPLVLRLITAAHMGMIPDLPGFPVEFIPWEITTYADRVRECDLALLPMPVTEWTRTKSPNRLLLCMALGVPAVVSPIPSNLEALTGDTPPAFVAHHPGDWLALAQRLMDPDLRNRLARQGLELVARNHSLKQTIPLWQAAFFDQAPAGQ